VVICNPPGGRVARTLPAPGRRRKRRRGDAAPRRQVDLPPRARAPIRKPRGRARKRRRPVAVSETPMARRRLVYEGKAKILYEGPEPGTLIQYFKDDATAFNAEKHEVIDGKGVLNNRISEHIMTALNNIGIATHFIRRINMREQLIRAVEIIPIEIVVRNIAAGSLSKRLGIKEGEVLPRPIIEFYYKDDKLGDPMVTEEHILAFNWAAQQDVDDMISLALRVNDFLSGLFLGVGIKLVDFKIECGRIWEGDFQRVIVADEISPDNCRLWDARTGAKYDKDVFRKDLGSLTEAYAEVAKRLGVLPEQPAKQGTGPKLVH
jgi:phosphoribosylaminoimidazole-succinocarboxamide synthase